MAAKKRISKKQQEEPVPLEDDENSEVTRSDKVNVLQTIRKGAAKGLAEHFPTTSIHFNIVSTGDALQQKVLDKYTSLGRNSPMKCQIVALWKKDKQLCILILHFE